MVTDIILMIINAVCAVIPFLPVYTDRYIVPVLGEESIEYRLRKVNALFRLEGSSVLYIGLSVIALSLVFSVLSLILKKYSFLRVISLILTVLAAGLVIVMLLMAAARSVKY